MKLVLKYLKPYTFLVLLCLGLLFGQAVCELYLPNLMSDIVDVGIMRSGVKQGAPEVISGQGLRLVGLFMPEDEKESFENSYAFIRFDSAEARSYTDKYIKASETDFYALKKDVAHNVDRLYTDAAYAFVLFVQEMTEEPGGGMEYDSESGIADVNTAELYALIPILESMPEGSLDPYISKARENTWLGSQIGATLAGLFYNELGVNLSSMQHDYIITIGLKMLGIAFLAVLAAISVGYFSSVISCKIAMKMRRDVFARVNSFSSAEYDRYSTASLITRSTNDIQQVQMLIMMGIRLMCYAPIMGIGGVIMAIRNSVSMSWIIAAAVIFLLGVILVMLSVAMPRFKALQKLIDKLNLVSRENLSGLMVIRAFGNEAQEEKRFDKSNIDLRNTTRFVQRTVALIMPMMMFIMNAVTITVIWVGAKEIAASSLQIGEMIAFMQYAMQIIMAFLMISMMFIMLPRAAVSAVRINEVLNSSITVKDSERAISLKNASGRIEYKNVCFRYENAEENALHNISFTALPGQTTAFIGATGSGKSTLVNLLPRFYDVTEGEVLIDGTNIRDMLQKELRENIGYVPQKGVLFSGTIKSNIAYSRQSATEREILESLEVAQASEFVSDKEEGINSSVAQGGSNVSGGQKQRLSIARALLKKPAIYIFDDSFSALDFKTDSALRKALKNHTGESTVLIVAQRVSTIMNAEQIIVLDGGRIVGKGNHKQLLQSCPEYREIAESQLSLEELG